MNPLRFARGEWTPWILAILALAIVILAIAWWARRRERRGDWGPGLANVAKARGYSPADLRGSAQASPVLDPHEAWLLGLAALYVEQAGLLHDRWSLVPAFCGDDWRRRLLDVAQSWGTVRSDDWSNRVANVEQQLSRELGSEQTASSGLEGDTDGEIDPRPMLVARLAMLLRLGVAARHISAGKARHRLAATAEPLRDSYGDWLSFGTALIEAETRSSSRGTLDLRADLRILYARGGPWHETQWPHRAGN